MPANFSENALRIIEARYLAHINGRRETVDEFVERVSLGNETYKRELIEPLNFLPNSPTLFNIDVPGAGTLSACFKFNVTDAMLDGSDGIMDTATKASMVIKWGGGVGYALGDIRPKGSLVNSTHGKAMGPVSVLKFYHSMASMLTQSGKREAAQMGILPVEHPDINEFIHCKDENPQALSTFNISVALSDSFMYKAVADIKNNVSSAEADLLKSMAQSAWRTGDPGVFFVDAAERDNPTPWVGKLDGTNPCGEVPLLNNEPCNLGSINLRKFYVGGSDIVDYDKLQRVVQLAISYLDDVLDHNHFPVSAVSDAAYYTRKLGLGVCGWADLLALAGIDYDSEEALTLLDKIMGFIRVHADAQSLVLGKEKGVAPCFVGTDIKYRNATRLCIAPTGTIAILMDASSGIEPHYLREWTRTTNEGMVLHEKISVLDETDFVPPTAMEIGWSWHVDHQGVAQEHVDLAVSKTINMANSATVEDILDAYIYMWYRGCKGGTVYRDGCRDTQVLAAITEKLTDTVELISTVEERCPECNGPVKHEEQCTECLAGCGWSACSV